MVGFINRMRQVAGQAGRRVARLVAGSVDGRAARRAAGLITVRLSSCSGATTAEYALVRRLLVVTAERRRFAGRACGHLGEVRTWRLPVLACSQGNLGCGLMGCMRHPACPPQSLQDDH